MSRVQENQFDLIVIGGGPGGSTLSTLVAMRGHKVLLLEREKHPRYRIGESTLPYTLGICKLLGLGSELSRAGFTKKLGGIWRWGTLENVVWVDFRAVVPEPVLDGAYAYQVERSKFDEILFRNALHHGVDARERHVVDDLIEENGRIVGVRYTDRHGNLGVARTRYVADAGGYSSRFHHLCGHRMFAERFRNFAVFCYFNGGKRLPEPMSGSILNVTFRHGWFWYIPLAPDLTSVGAVLPIAKASLLKEGHDQAMRGFIDDCPTIKEYLAGAERITEGMYGQYRIRKDWSYLNTKFWRPGLVLVGDAACFVDPLFSTGVHLSTYSALLAARSINTLLGGSSNEDLYFNEFERRYRTEYAKFYTFLCSFYDENQTKEEYFRTAGEILKGKEDDYKAFVRLVSGWSTSETGGAASTAAEKRTDSPPRTLSEKSFGNAFDESESDIFSMALGTAPSASRSDHLNPSADGLSWGEAPK